MSLSVWGFLLAAVAVILLALIIKPQHVGIGFPDPPGFARINTPRVDWNKEERTRTLPNGDSYEIPQGARGHFVVLFDWPVKCRFGKNSLDLTVPRGTPTDFASIPRCLHSLISPLNNTIYAALLHDYLYRNPGEDVARAVTRKEADRAFYWGMRACGVRKLTAGTMYLGVCAGGRFSYKRT